MMKWLAMAALATKMAAAQTPETATVYVYRNHNKFFGSLARIPVTCDGEMVGRAYNGKYLLLTMPVGDHSLEVRESGGGGRSGVELHLAAGQTYYVKVDQGVTVSMFQVSKAEATKALAKMKIGDQADCQH